MMLSQIPGLLRRTTPMVRGDQRGTIIHLSPTAWVVVIDAPDDNPDPEAGLDMSSGNNDPKGPGYWKWDVDTDHVTGWSHLAAWLTYKAQRCRTDGEQAARHREILEALGATPESYVAALDCALRCLPVDATGVDILRRYALRVGTPV